ncbi:type II secretion system F family protein [Proteocatella sphenisci]|uniref:type II secretion system F family protein n=1 Tax=Proteocatella sphenisci TaxID=181070 RepID=UPI00048B7E43|nr:type II secretion system F family protein [Proteocatella sphenisci]
MIGFYSESKLDIITSLKLIQEDIKNLDVATMLQKLKNGESLVKIFTEAGLTDEFIRATLEIGEKTENYKMAYKTSYGYLEEKSKSRNDLGKLVFYPILLFLMMFFLLFFISSFAIPQIYKVYTSMDTEIPLVMNWIMNINEFIWDNATIVKMIVLTLLFGILLWPDKTKAIRIIYTRLLRIKWIRIIYSTYYVNEISWQLYTLMEAGKDIVESLVIINKSISDKYMGMVIKDIICGLKKGAKLSDALAKRPEVFGASVITYAKTGEESGQLIENIKYIHKYTKRKIENSTDNFNKMVHPVVMIIIGIFLSGILAVLMPLLDVSSIYSGM